MKNSLLLFLNFIWLIPSTYAQIATKEYVSVSFEKVKKKEAQMYRLIAQNPDDTWYAKYYQIGNDHLVFAIDYKTKAIETKHGNYRAYFSSGKLKEEGNYKHGEKYGEWKTFRPNGQPKSIIKYYNNRLVAETKSWNSVGQLMWEGTTKEYWKEGTWTYYFESGKKQRVEHYSKGRKTGLIEEWYESGQLGEKQAYENGKKHGLYKLIGYEGNLLIEGQYKEGGKHGEWTSFLSNGEPESVKVYYNGEFIAETKNWDFDGRLIWEAETKEDKKEGVWTHYYRSGKISRIVPYVNGRKNGLFQEWYPNGQLGIELFYKNGNIHGVFKKWSETGILLDSGSYVDGEKRGVWSSFNSDGSFNEYTEYEPITVDSISVSSKQIKVDSVFKGDIVVFAEQSAAPLGGLTSFRKYLAKYVQIKYPLLARKRSIYGTVFVSFVVEKNGTLSNFTILKGIGYDCDEVAIEAIKSYGKWIPGKQQGKSVRQSFKFPVKFRL